MSIVLSEKRVQLVANLGVVGHLLLVEESQNLIEIVARHSTLQGLEDIACDLVAEVEFLLDRWLRGLGCRRLLILRRQLRRSQQED